MDADTFDDVVKRLTASGSRRALLRLVAGIPILGLLATVVDDAAAATPRKASRHRHRRRTAGTRQASASDSCAHQCRKKHSKQARRKCRKRCTPPTPACTTPQDCPPGELC